MGGKQSKQTQDNEFKTVVGHLKGTSYHTFSKEGWTGYWKDKTKIKINKDSLCPCHKAGDEKTPHNLGDSIAGAHAYYIDNTGKVYFGIIPTCSGCNTSENPIVYDCTMVTIINNNEFSVEGSSLYNTMESYSYSDGLRLDNEKSRCHININYTSKKSFPEKDKPSATHEYLNYLMCLNELNTKLSTEKFDNIPEIKEIKNINLKPSGNKLIASFTELAKDKKNDKKFEKYLKKSFEEVNGLIRAMKNIEKKLKKEKKEVYGNELLFSKAKYASNQLDILIEINDKSTNNSILNSKKKDIRDVLKEILKYYDKHNKLIKSQTIIRKDLIEAITKLKPSEPKPEPKTEPVSKVQPKPRTEPETETESESESESESETETESETESETENCSSYTSTTFYQPAQPAQPVYYTKPKIANVPVDKNVEILEKDFSKMKISVDKKEFNKWINKLWNFVKKECPDVIKTSNNPQNPYFNEKQFKSCLRNMNYSVYSSYEDFFNSFEDINTRIKNRKVAKDLKKSNKQRWENCDWDNCWIGLVDNFASEMRPVAWD
jgi:flagellar hook-basal body complex protein FliE